MSLRDEMAELMPGLKWTRPMSGVAVGKLGTRCVVRVFRESWSPPPFAVVLFATSWYGRCQSTKHAATTIRRKFIELRDVMTRAVEAARKGGEA